MTIDGLDVGREQEKCQETWQRDEEVLVMTNGERRVRAFAPRHKTKTIALPRLTDAQKQSLETRFNTDNIDQSSNQFTVIDDYNVSFTCRLKGNIKFKRRLGRFWRAEFTVWIET